jgi:amino acid permease
LLKAWNIIDFKYSDESQQLIDESDPLTIKWRYICLAILALIIYPVNCIKNLASIRYVSFAILLIVLYTVIVAIVEFPEFYNHYNSQGELSVHWWAAPFKLDWFRGWATIMLSYNCLITLFYVRGELMNKTPERSRKISRTLISVLAVFYVLISVTGYLSVGDKNMPNLFTLRSKLPGSNDIPMQIAQVAFLFAALFHIPITLFPSREQIYIFYKVDRTTTKHMLLTAIMTSISFLIPAILPNIRSILGLLGGLTIGTSGYLMPVVMKIAHLRSKQCSWISASVICHLLLMLCIFTLQVTSIYVSITTL